MLAEDEYVFAVKGGISLGSYEAGLNWVYIEQLRQYQHKNTAKLDTFVGASAGSINSLLSAIRYCQKIKITSGRKIFQQTWDVGMQHFFAAAENNVQDNKPDNEQGKQRKPRKRSPNESLSEFTAFNKNTQGIFSRKGLKLSLDYVKELLNQSGENFREGCQVKIGISITKLVPDVSVVAGIDVLNQRYVIPLLFKIESGRVTFRNYQPENSQFSQSDNYLYLPAPEGVVDHESVLNALLASSAFPVTFSPVKVAYCRASNIDSVKYQNTCPAQYQYHEDLFIDGGNFDNAPIGAALNLHDEKGIFENSVVLFVNPDRRRIRTQTSKGPFSTESNPNAKKNPAIIGLKEYLGLGYHIFDYGMTTELYQAARRIEYLKKQSSTNRPNIRLSDRYYPVIGDYLYHFAAFFDQSFRQFDFNVGAYDAVIQIAETQCVFAPDQENMIHKNKCISSQAKQIVDDLGEQFLPSIAVFRRLASREFREYFYHPHWSWLRKDDAQGANTLAHALFDSLVINSCHAPQQKKCKDPVAQTSFDHFLSSLKKKVSVYDQLEPETQQMLSQGDSWKYTLLDNSMERLYEIEKNKNIANRDDSGELFDLLKMSTYVGKTYFMKQSTGLWPVSTLNSRASHWSKLVPDEVGISYRQTSVYLKYKSEFRLPFDSITSSIESRFIPIDWVSRTRNVNKILGGELVAKTHFSNPLFSTLGVGYGYYNVDFFGHSPDGKLESFANPLHGLIIDFGAIAGKIKVSFIYRGGELNDSTRGYVNWAVNLGLSDIKGLSWLW